MAQTKKILKLFFILIFLNSCEHAEKTDYIFPQKYKGCAVVLYNVKGAKKCPIKDGRVQVEIPENGILFTSNKRPEGILDNRYLIKTNDKSYNKVYPDLESISRSDLVSSYIVAESYESIRINKTYALHPERKTTNDEWVNYDEMIVFKISSGFSDTTAYETELDSYLESLKGDLLNYR